MNNKHDQHLFKFAIKTFTRKNNLKKNKNTWYKFTIVENLSLLCSQNKIVIMIINQNDFKIFKKMDVEK